MKLLWDAVGHRVRRPARAYEIESTAEPRERSRRYALFRGRPGVRRLRSVQGFFVDTCLAEYDLNGWKARILSYGRSPEHPFNGTRAKTASVVDAWIPLSVHTRSWRCSSRRNG